MTKSEMLRAGLARLAEKLDQQWAVAQGAEAAEGSPFACAYEGMTAALVAMGGEWKRDAAGHHWVYLCGQSATAEGVE